MTNRLKQVFAATLALLLTLSLAACALPSPVPVEDGSPNVASDFTPSGEGTSEQSSSGFAVDVSDMAGNQVRLSVYPERIVVLDPADCEILYAIGAGPNVVGRSLSCDYPDEVNMLPYATSDGRNDADLLLLRQPQLVVMGPEDAADSELVTALASAGVAILVTNATDINNMYGAISLLGTVTNHTNEANALVSQLITQIATMQTKISSHAETVYLELTPLDEGITTSGGGTIFNSIVAQLGFHNEFEDQSGILSVTQDQVVGRSPDIIITAERDRSLDAVDPTTTIDPTATADPTTTADPATGEPALTGPAEILARADWATVDAVKSGRVYYVPAALITRAGPRILEGMQALYSILYDKTQPEFE